MARKKAVSNKVATRKAGIRKTTAARKKVTVPAATKPKAISEKQSKTQIIREIAQNTDLTGKQVAAVFGELNGVIHRHMMRRGSGEITIPETGIKIRRVRKAATRPRKGVNPRTGEPMVFKAKPARNAIRITALKTLKDMIA